MDLENFIDKLKRDRNRASTKKNYYCVWKQFNEFYIKLDEKPDSWEERIVLFVAFLIDNKKKSTTVNSYVSAIKSVLAEDGIKINEDRFLLTSLLRACRLVNDRVRTRLPIKRKLLNLLLDSIEWVYGQKENQPYLGTLYKALFSIGYHGLFRVGELTTGDHPVLAKDVHIANNKKKLLFVLRTSKTHWKDVNPQVIKIKSTENCEQDKNYCPFAILRNYLMVRPTYISDEEPFFVFSDRSPVAPKHMRNVMKLVLKLNDLEPRLYGTHSLRIGKCHDLLEANISVPVISKLGRWKSNVVYKYLS